MGKTKKTTSSRKSRRVGLLARVTGSGSSKEFRRDLQSSFKRWQNLLLAQYPRGEEVELPADIMDLLNNREPNIEDRLLCGMWLISISSATSTQSGGSASTLPT